VVSHQKILSRDAKRAGKLDSLITYQDTKTMQLFTTIIPNDNPTDPEITNAIKADEAARSRIMGKEYSV
jgi:hypothetical protein